MRDVGKCPICKTAMFDSTGSRIVGVATPRISVDRGHEVVADPIRDGELVHQRCLGHPAKLWHDDIREPPDDSWTWARTNQAALDELATGWIYEASLDHDLGYHGLDPALYDSPECLEEAAELIGEEWSKEDGCDLVRQMIARGLIPCCGIRIHSWNPPGAERMAAMLTEAGCPHVTVLPFSDSERGAR